MQVLVQLPGGSLVGGGKLTKKDAGWILFDLTSYTFVGDTLYAAGPVTKVSNPQGIWQVGQTFFVGMNDNGNGAGNQAADEFIEGGVPPWLGALDIEEILAITGPAPPEIFRQGISGNLTVH